MSAWLLDTHTFLWAVMDDPSLSAAARQHFLDPDLDLFLSLASVWEMAIKYSLGKLHLQRPVQEFVAIETQRNEIRLLGIDLDHCQRVSLLPFHHRDPFDRMLAAQALVNGLALLSADAIFDRYGVARTW